MASKPRAATSRRRTPARTRLAPDERERLIARGAVAFFCEVGFGGQTRELAKRLGITQPLLYRYFPNKEALIDRVYQEVYLNRWDPHWEEVLDDHTRPARERVVAFYREYAKAVLSYEWIRIFMFSGLRGMNLNSRYLTLVRDRIYTRVIREVRLAYGLPSPRGSDRRDGVRAGVGAAREHLLHRNPQVDLRAGDSRRTSTTSWRTSRRRSSTAYRPSSRRR